MLRAVHVRIATRADLDAITAIHDRAILTSTATFDLTPLDPAGRERWFARFGTLDPLLVAEDGGRVLGFAHYAPFRLQPAYVHTKEVSAFVAEEARGQGVAKALYRELIRRARSSGVHALVAVLGGENEASSALHKSFGFELIGTLPEVGFKFGHWIDVTLWHRLV
jgi:phosphinothricin acetyltransferase